MYFKSFCMQASNNHLQFGYKENDYIQYITKHDNKRKPTLPTT